MCFFSLDFKSDSELMSVVLVMDMLIVFVLGLYCVLVYFNVMSQGFVRECFSVVIDCVEILLVYDFGKRIYEFNYFFVMLCLFE